MTQVNSIFTKDFQRQPQINLDRNEVGENLKLPPTLALVILSLYNKHKV